MRREPVYEWAQDYAWEFGGREVHVFPLYHPAAARSNQRKEEMKRMYNRAGDAIKVVLDAP